MEVGGGEGGGWRVEGRKGRGGEGRGEEVKEVKEGGIYCFGSGFRIRLGMVIGIGMGVSSSVVGRGEG